MFTILSRQLIVVFSVRSTYVTQRRSVVETRNVSEEPPPVPSTRRPPSYTTSTPCKFSSLFDFLFVCLFSSLNNEKCHVSSIDRWLVVCYQHIAHDTVVICLRNMSAGMSVSVLLHYSSITWRKSHYA